MNTTVSRLDRVGRLTDHLTKTRRELPSGLRRHALLYALSAGTLIVALGAAILTGRLFQIELVLLFSLPVATLVIGFIAWFVACEAFRLWQSGYQGSPIREVARLLLREILEPRQLVNLLHAGLALALFMAAFNTLKILLPALHPFQWDTTFMEWDRLIHLGFDPYRILQPVLGHPVITFGLSFAYSIWFFVMFAFWMWQGAAKADSEVRQRFLVAFVITWFLGTNVLGTLFSSVGPCFYGRLISGPDPYQPLMAYLRDTAQIVPVWPLNVQDLLWHSYMSGQGVIAGISAMPSMHVGSTTLLAISAFAAGRSRLGWCLVLYTAVIFLGSVHLAWHYAIDGYAGAAVAFFGWFAAGRLVRRDRARQGLRAA